METDKRLVLRYENGQFTFRNFDHSAGEEELFRLAHGLNAFQEDRLASVIKVRVIQF